MLRYDVLARAEPAQVPDLAAATREGDRGVLAARVAERQVELGAPPEAIRAAESLARPDAAVIVTGQQPGLLGGPLLVLAKALSTLAWARRLEAECGRTIVPVFWAATEDHDVVEVNRTVILDAEERLVDLSLPLTAGPTMLSHLGPGPGVEELLARAEESLPSGDNRAQATAPLVATLSGSLGDWFSRLISTWLGRFGLVVVEPSLFRSEAAAVLRLERDRPGAIREACGPGPLDIADPPFFLVDEEGRRARATRATLPADPERISWDVASRVLAQNVALPVAGHVVGPSEMLYCEQLAPAHALFDIPAPPLLRRAGLVLLERKVDRALERFGVALPDLLDRGEEALIGSEVRPEEFDRAVKEATVAIENAWVDVRDEAGRVDEVLLKKAEGAEMEMFRAIDRLRDHARKAMDRATGRDREMREKLLNHVLPRGAPQERILSPLPFLARHGLILIDELLEVVSTHPSSELAVHLSKSGRGHS